MKSVEKIIGLIFITIGVLFTFTNMGLINIQMDFLWPIFILVPGLIFEYSYFSTKRAPGLLFPGAILTSLGLIFFFHTLTRFMFIEYLWPLFILPTGLAFLQFYFYGYQQKVFLILFFLFAAMTTFFIAFQFFIFKPYLVLSMVFILVGIIFLSTGKSNSKQ